MPDPRGQNRKKPRRLEYLATIANKYYIFCEGEQTEPLYFKGFENAIKSNPIYKNMVHVEVQGVGAETLRVIYAAESHVRENRLRNAQIWCVYDKDSFPAQDFNAVSEHARNLNCSQSEAAYHVAWSNQCVEYWFILHFDWYDADNDRKYYRKYLHKKFAKRGWTRYEKNNSELFNILTQHGNPKQAIKWAKKRLEQCKGLTDTSSSPATMVHVLIEELAQYLPDEIKLKYL